MHELITEQLIYRRKQSADVLSAARTRLAITNLNFFYGDDQALFDISCAIPDKRVTALIGPSGCGKSTLLRVLNRMYDLYPGQRATGDVRLDGENLLDSRVNPVLVRAKIGMVFQKPTPFPMSIRDNIAYGLKLNERLSRSSVADRIEWSLRKAALWEEVKDRLDASALGLSGGQQQRLCIARAIAVRPDVVLFDEPTSALDPISTAKIEALIDELKSDFTIVIVTHNMQQAARCSDVTGFMLLGEMKEFGPTTEIFNQPAHPETAAYITGRFG